MCIIQVQGCAKIFNKSFNISNRIKCGSELLLYKRCNGIVLNVADPKRL